MITSQDDKWEQFVFIMRTAPQRESCYKICPAFPSSTTKLEHQLRNKQTGSDNNSDGEKQNQWRSVCILL